MTAPTLPETRWTPAVRAALEICLQTFRRFMHLPDPGPVLFSLGVVVSNQIDGDPVWGLLVGGPSSGKTEPIRTLEGQPNCYQVGYLTEASLLSGTPKKNHGAGARGGLLREIGAFGILMPKDFTSVLSMQRDTRASLLAALREIFDGTWTRNVGTDGGQTLHWAGKVGLLGAVTGAIDSAHQVMATMGERFLLYRMPDTDAGDQGSAALARPIATEGMRRELQQSVADVLALADPTKTRNLTDTEGELLVAVATLVARGRSAVERDGYTREILNVPAPEAPPRLVLCLRQLLYGLEAIGLETGEALGLVTKTALDSMPQLRRLALEHLAATKTATTGEVAAALDHPTNTTRRALEDITAHGLVRREKVGGSKGDLWELSELGRRLWKVCVSETSETERATNNSLNTPLPLERDKSGTQIPEPPSLSEDDDYEPDFDLALLEEVADA